ncbi:TrlF family AAA-like ATPase [Cobetia crustatorum]|uniref:DNA repair protein n=1 Tax=Cobetia crustatorum TaxID=553385 RepID=A0A558HN24_9GAMM|nr:DNA repair protein [Cobetia crustatorum]TVU70532.1 DNA repair protein [Cobetia crustatorum]
MIGSVWNKWDLHIHTPLTHQANEFSGLSIEDYVKKVSECDLRLIGVTNYFYFADEELEIVREEIRKQGKSITVLGNLEFRITQPNKDGEWINIHCIFSENMSTDKINEVMSYLTVENTTSDSRPIYLSKSSFSNSGLKVEAATVNFNMLVEHLNKSLKFGVDYIIAACPNGYGGFRPNMNVGRSLAIAFEIEKKCQVILARPEDRDFFLKEDRYDSAIQKPVFYASDAHKFSDIGSKYSWVKSKPTFEGLRQVIIEPDQRVQQSDDFVDRTYIKPFFKSISLEGKVFMDGQVSFVKQNIPLNPNLVAIIGGRGTGKSLFLDAMYSRFNSQASKSKARDVNPESLCLDLDKGDGEVISFNSTDHNYPYLHVSQGDVQYYSQKPEVLSDEIKEMLGISGVEFDDVVRAHIASLLDKHRHYISKDVVFNTDVESIDTDEYQDNIIVENERILATLTNPTNRDLIEKYQENSKLINERSSYIDSANSALGVIVRLSSDMNEEVEIVNKSYLTEEKLPSISSKVYQDIVRKNVDKCHEFIDALRADNQGIVAQFQSQGINQDISSLLNKVKECQSAIDRAVRKKQEIASDKQGHARVLGLLSDEIGKYRDYLVNQKRLIDEAFNKLTESNDEWNEEQNSLVGDILKNIEINGNIVFDMQAFYTGLESCINRGKFRSTNERTTFEKLVSTFNVSSEEDFFSLVSGCEVINIDGDLISVSDFCNKQEYFNKSGRFELFEYLYNPRSVKKYLYVNADFKYMGKTVDKLSVGQRGTFYVCLKLATDPFGSPFVFDQPEDDLDNEFIMSQLVPLFRVIKKYRQVIIVTHNANLVINTDAEQVVVAANNNEEIKYSSGAVEDGCLTKGQSLRASICNVLEGGSYAFEKRERKYGIKGIRI